MENDHIKHILEQLESGQLTASDAYDQLKLAPFEDLGYAKVDHHREVRQGAPEVIYGASKTKEQMGGIINSLLSQDFRQNPRRTCPNVLIFFTMSCQKSAS